MQYCCASLINRAHFSLYITTFFPLASHNTRPMCVICVWDKLLRFTIVRYKTRTTHLVPPPSQSFSTFTKYPKQHISFLISSAIEVQFVFGATVPQWARASSFTRFLDHTQRRTTVGRTSLDEWWARRRDLYLTTHKTHNRQTSMPPVRFEPTISAGARS